MPRRHLPVDVQKRSQQSFQQGCEHIGHRIIRNIQGRSSGSDNASSKDSD